MRVIVCGSRDWLDVQMIRQRIRALPLNTTIVHGGATGADTIAHNCARERGFHVEVYPADWATFGKRAGPIRNAQMLDRGADLVIAFHKGDSPGTRDMIRRARRAAVPVDVVAIAAPTEAQR